MTVNGIERSLHFHIKLYDVNGIEISLHFHKKLYDVNKQILWVVIVILRRSSLKPGISINVPYSPVM